MAEGDSGRLKACYTGMIFIDLGIKVDGAYHCDLLLSQLLLPAIVYTSTPISQCPNFGALQFFDINVSQDRVRRVARV